MSWRRHDEGGLALRASSTIAVFVIGLAGSAGPALAQYYPAQQPGYQPAYRHAPTVVAEDDDIPPYDAPSTRRNAPPGVYAAPGVYQADPRYGRPVPPAGVEAQELPPNTRYGRAAPMPPDADGYVPAPPPGYISPAPAYEQAQPQQPGPGYARPAPEPYYPAAASSAAMPPATQSPVGQQDAVRPPLPLSPGQIAPMQEATGTVQPGPRTIVASLPAEDQPETGPRKELPPQFRRTMVNYQTKHPAGTIVIDTASTYLYLVMGNGKALRYGVGVGRDGFRWSGVQKVTRMAEWPDWHPPEEMIERQPYLPRFMAGGDGNPLGARALYLGNTVYRIHGTNQPSTIGTFVSSGCIRLTNEDVEDLYTRVKVGTRVVVLPGGKLPAIAATQPPATASAMPPAHSRTAPLPPPISVR